MPPREQILATLRDHAPELRAAGLAHLRLFGSFARGEATPDSDVDLLADFAPDSRISLLGFVHLQNRLSEILGVTVDLSSAKGLKDLIRDRVLKEAISAF